MRRKKGFTLIELLAVIVVLAIILVLALPRILEVIENAEKQAYKESVELMAHTARLQYQTGEVTGGVAKIPEGGIVYEFENGDFVSSDKLNFKGDKPFSGTITLTEDKKVVIDKLVSKNKKWCAIKEANEKQARVGRSTDPAFECIVEEDKPIVDKKECDLEEGTETIEGIETTVYYIDSPSDLYAFSKSINSGDKTYIEKIVKVRNNLDMSDTSNTCGESSFAPIGVNKDLAYTGKFDGGAKTISNLTINRSGQNYVGLFGYIKEANIVGLTLKDSSITGNDNVGGLVGYIESVSSPINEIVLDNVDVYSSKTVGGFAGAAPYTASINNVVLKNGLIKRSTKGYYMGMIVGTTYNGSYRHSMYKNVIAYDMEMSNNNLDSYYYTTSTTDYSYLSASSKVNDNLQTWGFSDADKNDINFYEAAGLDTWIGGDIDNSGYYFDYDISNNIVLKSTKSSPITFKLKGEGTEEKPYLIKTVKDWKEFSGRAQTLAFYKLENDLDFSTNNFYMAGSFNNKLNATLDGNGKKLKNITINAAKADYVGFSGYILGGNIHGLNIDNIELHGSNYVGTAGYIDGGTMKGLTINNIIVTSYNHAGSAVGYIKSVSSPIKELLITNIDVSSNRYVGGIVGTLSDSDLITSVVLKGGKINRSETSYSAGLLFGNYASGSYVFRMFKNALVSDIEFTTNGGSYIYTTSAEYYSFTSNTTTVNGSATTWGYDPGAINDINMYEAAGLDTWIGGDDGSGYYFDYNDAGQIVLKNINDYPIEFDLEKDSDGNYLIKSEDDWKMATVNLDNNYKIMNDLNFSNKKYYMLGSFNNQYNGNLYGNGKKISNVIINADKANYIGLIGYSNSKEISDLNLKDISIKGYDYTGLFAYTNGVVMSKLFVDNVNVIGNNYSSVIIGYSQGGCNLTTVVASGSVQGASYTGGIVGSNVGSRGNIQEIQVNNMNVKGTTSVGGIVGFGNYGVNYNSVLVKNVSVYGDKYVNGLSANNSDKPNNTVVENMIVVGTSGTDIYTNWSNDTTYILNYSLTRNKGNASENTFGTSNSKEVNDINMYEAAGLDTWIGADNNTTGYYFDYDSNNSIVLKSVKDNPFAFTLKGSGTENDPYLIENEKHWKEVSARPLSTDYYKVVNNLDFSTNKYYMLGSANTPFQGNFNGDMKQINNITINASSTPVIGVFGKVSKTKISKLNLNNVNISGANNTGGIVGYLVGPSYITTVKINGNVKGATNVGGTVGTNYSATSYLDEAEIANMVIRGTSSVGGLTGNTSYGVRNSNILVKNMEIYGDKYVYASVSNNNSDVKGAVFENLKIVGTTSTSIYTGYSGETKYIIKYTLTRSVGTESEEILTSDDSSNLGNLPYYANMIETLYTGDTNNTGYFFDYDSSKNGIYLTKAYSLTFTSPPSDDSSDTNTEGGGTDADTCYITISCSGSGSYRNCYINYYENGVSEAPYLNTMTLDLTRGSSCAAYSPSNSPGGFSFYVKKKSTSSCSVTFRARSNKDCITTTYKTISF